MSPTPGLTKMRSIGPLAEELRRASGSIDRIFRRADLPLQLLDEPERVILLSDQLHLLECAAREIGDASLPARLATSGGILALGRYGQRSCSAPRLNQAIVLADELISSFLQSETRVKLKIKGNLAHWTYVVTDGSRIGRQKNEILAVGYMLDLMRTFLGAGWDPLRATVAGGSLPGRAAAEIGLRCELSLGAEASLQFPTELLDATNPRRIELGPVADADMPRQIDFATCVEHLIELGLLEGRPSFERLCRHLEMSPRSIQRRLGGRGLTFEALVRGTLTRRAQDLLSQGILSVAEIAQTLGYSDQAHFCRAFKSWTGSSPRAWQLSMRRP